MAMYNPSPLPPGRTIATIVLSAVASWLLIASAAELAARLLWRTESSPACIVEDARLGHRNRANCTEIDKAAEAPLVVLQYNECGQHTARPCLPPVNAVSIAVSGNSFLDGAHVALEDSAAERMQDTLQDACRMPIHTTNFSVRGYGLFQIYLGFEEVLQSRPRIAVVGVMPNDLFTPITQVELDNRHDTNARRTSPLFANSEKSRPSLLTRARRLANALRISVVIQHYLLQRPSVYLRAYTARGETSGYLQPVVPAGWQDRYRVAELLLGEMAEAARQAGTRLVIVSLPQRAQAVLADRPALSPDLDPRAFSTVMSGIAARIGAGHLDGLSLVQGDGPVAPRFYPVDGHLDGRGHRRLGESLAQQLLADPIFRDVCTR